MRLATSAACLALVALAGCKQQPSVKMKNASLDQVMDQQVAAVKLKPGEWQMTVETKDMKMTGAPAGMPPMPQQATVVTKTCITPEQAAKPTAMLGGGNEQFRKGCIYDSFEMKGGKIDAVMHCDTPQGMKLRATTHGSMSETSLSAESQSEVSGMPNGMGMSTKVKIDGKRIGECPAAPAAG